MHIPGFGFTQRPCTRLRKKPGGPIQTDPDWQLNACEMKMVHCMHQLPYIKPERRSESGNVVYEQLNGFFLSLPQSPPLLLYLTSPFSSFLDLSGPISLPSITGWVGRLDLWTDGWMDGSVNQPMDPFNGWMSGWGQQASGCMCKSLQSCPPLCKPMIHSPPCFSVHGILQA